MKRKQPFLKTEGTSAFSNKLPRQEKPFRQRKEQARQPYGYGKNGPSGRLLQRRASAPPGKGRSGPARAVSVQRQDIPPAKYARL